MRREDRERTVKVALKQLLRMRGQGEGMERNSTFYFSLWVMWQGLRLGQVTGVTVCKVNLNVLIGSGGFWETQREQWYWETPQLCYLRERERKIEGMGRNLKPVYTIWILPQVCNCTKSTTAFVKNLNHGILFRRNYFLLPAFFSFTLNLTPSSCVLLLSSSQCILELTLIWGTEIFLSVSVSWTFPLFAFRRWTKYLWVRNDVRVINDESFW